MSYLLAGLYFKEEKRNRSGNIFSLKQIPLESQWLLLNSAKQASAALHSGNVSLSVLLHSVRNSYKD